MRQVLQSFPVAGTEEGRRGATVLVPMTESACQVKYVGPVCSLLCPAQTGQEFQGRQHSWRPQLLGTSPHTTMYYASVISQILVGHPSFSSSFLSLEANSSPSHIVCSSTSSSKDLCPT